MTPSDPVDPLAPADSQRAARPPEDGDAVAKALDALRAAHTFPGPFTFKAIGANEPTFTAAILQAVVAALGPKVRPELDTRPSAKGRHQAVHVRAHVQSAEQVVQAYALLRGVPGLKMLL